MKTIRSLILGCFLFFSVSSILSQEAPQNVILKKDFKIQKHTIMERFEPAYIVSAQKREQMKRKRIADAEHTIGVLDTIKISNRKRKRLLKDLKYNPSSERLNKFIVDTKFSDEDLANQQE